MCFYLFLSIGSTTEPTATTAKKVTTESPAESSTPVVCTEEEYACADGLTCVSANHTCDYFVDCDDNSDEDERAGCVCDLAYEFQCASGGCVNDTWVCDGEGDCYDGSDEAAVLCGNVTEAGTTISPSKSTTAGAEVTKARFTTPVSPAKYVTGKEVTQPEVTTVEEVTKSEAATPVSPAESITREEVTQPEGTTAEEVTKPGGTTPVSPAKAATGEEVTKPEVTTVQEVTKPEAATPIAPVESTEEATTLSKVTTAGKNYIMLSIKFNTAGMQIFTFCECKG